MTEAELSAAQETFFFTTNPPAADGSDIVVVAHPAAGAPVELPREILDINIGAGTFSIWARYDDLDDEYGDALADAVFSIQWGGDGPTLAATDVYDDNYVQVDDYEFCWHMEDAASGTVPDAAGHYDGTEDGTVDNAAGQVDGAGDFERGDANDGVRNNAAANLERTDLWTVMAWVRPETVGINEHLMGNNINAAPYQGWQVSPQSTNAIGMWLINNYGANLWARAEMPSADTGWSGHAGTWHMIVFTYSGTGTVAGMRGYYDGREIPLTTVRDTLGANSIQSGDPLNVGNRGMPLGSAGEWFDGRIDEARVIQHAAGVLSREDIRTHYNNEYTSGDNGVWDWAENTGTNPGAPAAEAAGQPKIANTIGVGAGF